MPAENIQTVLVNGSKNHAAQISNAILGAMSQDVDKIIVVKSNAQKQLSISLITLIKRIKESVNTHK